MSGWEKGAAGGRMRSYRQGDVTHVDIEGADALGKSPPMPPTPTEMILQMLRDPNRKDTFVESGLELQGEPPLQEGEIWAPHGNDEGFMWGHGDQPLTEDEQMLVDHMSEEQMDEDEFEDWERDLAHIAQDKTKPIGERRQALHEIWRGDDEEEPDYATEGGAPGGHPSSHDEVPLGFGGPGEED